MATVCTLALLCNKSNNILHFTSMLRKKIYAISLQYLQNEIAVKKTMALTD